MGVEDDGRAHAGRGTGGSVQLVGQAHIHGDAREGSARGQRRDVRGGRPGGPHVHQGHPVAGEGPRPRAGEPTRHSPVGLPESARHPGNAGPALRPAGPRGPVSTPRLAAALAVLVVLVVLVVHLVSQCSATGAADQDAQQDSGQADTSVDADAQTGSSDQVTNLTGTPGYAPVREAMAAAAAPYGSGISVVYLPLDDPYAGGTVNADTQMSSASMIKMAVLATFLQQVEDGTIGLDTTYTIRQSDVVSGTGSLQGSVGKTFTYDELAEHMIYESDNVATNVLIGIVGMANVNAECQSLGLSQTHLGHLMMKSGDGDNTTSAADMAAIFQLIANGQLVSQEQSERALGYLKEQEDDDGIVAGLPEGTVVANKTGSADTVRHDGGIVYASHPYVLVVMTSGLGEGTANEAMAAISKAVWDASVQVGAA